MKPGALGTPSRDLGQPTIRPLAEALIRRLEAVEARLAKPGQVPAVLSAERGLLDRLDQQTGDAVTLERKRVRDRALDEVYFSIPHAAGMVSVFTGPVTTVANADANVLRFGPGALGAVERQNPTRQLWVNTVPTISVWYTSPVGSTNNFSFRFLVRPFGAGSTTTAAALSITWTAPGPAVANTIQLTKARIAGRVWSSPIGSLETRLVRVAPDANANDLDVILAVVVLEEVA